VIVVRPYETWLGNTIEMINESLVICTIYIMHCFSFFIPKVGTRYRIGWIYVGIVGIVYLVNIFVILKAVVEFIIMVVKNEKKGRIIRNHLKGFIQLLREFAKTRRRNSHKKNIVAVMPSDSTANGPENDARMIFQSSLEVINEESGEESRMQPRQKPFNSFIEKQRIALSKSSKLLSLQDLDGVIVIDQ
jgi:hypothetical protein